MAKPAKRVRWECPNGRHPAVLGSTRPPADAVVRYCLPCSQEAGRLVARVAPVLEAQRATKAAARAAKQQAGRERERAARAQALLVTCLDYEAGEVTLDAEELLRAAWRTTAIRERLRDHWRHPGRQPVPGLTPADTYTVERIMVRGTKTFPKGLVEDVYCDQVGELAYLASCYRNDASHGGVWHYGLDALGIEAIGR